MRLALFLTGLLISLCINAQEFPAGWLGNWKGELHWYQGATKEPKKVAMELRIGSTDSSHRFSWQMIYGTEGKDNRPYTLIAVDTAKGHWRIDEHNGILLDQYRVANKLSGAFTVQSSTILNNYWLQGEELHIEFYTISAKPVAVTGEGTEASPSVNSYQVKSYQKAVLHRTQ